MQRKFNPVATHLGTVQYPPQDDHVTGLLGTLQCPQGPPPQYVIAAHLGTVQYPPQDPSSHVTALLGTLQCLQGPPPQDTDAKAKKRRTTTNCKILEDHFILCTRIIIIN